MAKLSEKNSFNVEGTYYVDLNCIACDACLMEAPRFFKMNDDESLAFVSRQPRNEKEVEACENALACCPVESIGNDG